MTTIRKAPEGAIAPASKRLTSSQLNALVGAFVHRNPFCDADNSYCGGRAGNARGRMIEGLREMGLIYTYPGRNRPPAAGKENELTVAGLRALHAHLTSRRAPLPANGWGGDKLLPVDPIIARLDAAIVDREKAEAEAAQRLADYEANEARKAREYSQRERTRKLARFRQVIKDHGIEHAGFEDEEYLLGFCEQIVDAEMDV